MDIKTLLLILLFPAFLFGQNKYADKIDQYMKAEADFYNFSGTVLVKKNNKIIFQKAFGYADMEWDVKTTIDTKYRICSISKLFSATSILILEQEGKLSVNDKLSKYIKDFPNGDKITLHMLLSHTSGITVDFEEVLEYAVPNEKDTMLSIIKKSKLGYEPGTDYNYCNSNYFLLAYVVEQVSKQSYSAFLTEHIFSKANMQNTLIDNFDTIVSKRAVGYGFDIGHYIHESNRYIPNAFGAGDILSTVGDLNKFDSALIGNNILNEKSKAKMYTSYNTKEPDGYGFKILSFQNRKLLQKSGSDGGFKTSIVRNPSDSTCVVVLSNNRSNGPILSFAITGILYDAVINAAKKHCEKMIDTTILKKYVGAFRENYMGISGDLKVITKNGKLYQYVNGEDDIELKPESEKSFFYTNGQDRQLEFETDAKGNVIKAWRSIAGLKVDLIRLK